MAWKAPPAHRPPTHPGALWALWRFMRGAVACTNVKLVDALARVR